MAGFDSMSRAIASLERVQKLVASRMDERADGLRAYDALELAQMLNERFQCRFQTHHRVNLFLLAVAPFLWW